MFGTNCFPSRPPCRPPELAPCSPRCSLASSLRRHSTRRALFGRWRRRHARKFGPANVALRHDRGGRESCTAREVDVGDSKQWRQSAFGADGKYTRLQGRSAFGDDGEYTRLQGQRAFGGDGKDTRLQGHQAAGVLQTVRGEAGSITRRAGGCQASAHRGTEVGCRRRRRRVPRDRRGALATSQQPTWRALVLPLQLHQATDGDQAGFPMVFAAPSIYGRPVAPWLRHLCSDGCGAAIVA